MKILFIFLFCHYIYSFPHINVTVLNYKDPILIEEIQFHHPKEEILLEDETVKLFQRVTDSGILYEYDAENGEVNGLDFEAGEEDVEILMDDGTSRFFSKVSEDGMLYDETPSEGAEQKEEKQENSEEEVTDEFTNADHEYIE